MGLTTQRIKKRWQELVQYRRQGLEARNASEHYEKDVGDLIRMNEALMKLNVQMNMRLNEAQGKPVQDFKVYWDTLDNGVERLLTRKFLMEDHGKKTNLSVYS